jgi:Tfp pilus assembly protein PilX
MMVSIKKQKGAVLVVSLVMLVIMTLLAVSSINISTVNLRIVENMQEKKRNEAAVNDALEQVMSDIDYFDSPTTTPTITVDSLDVDVAQRECLGSTPATGYSAAWTLVPEDTHWDASASLTDASTGAKTTIHQGVKIRMSAGGCS